MSSIMSVALSSTALTIRVHLSFASGTRRSLSSLMSAVPAMESHFALKAEHS